MKRAEINLTSGVPPPDFFPVEDLIACGEAGLRRDGSVLLQYSHAGYPPLREWIANRYRVGAERVLTGNSSLEGFAFIVQVFAGDGQRAFVESPSYGRSITLLRHNDTEVVGIPLLKDGVDLDVLEEELRRAFRP